MRAIRFAGVGRPAEIADVPKPSPGPGQIVIKIGGAGVCHSDLFVASLENLAIAGYGPWGCGRCHACHRSMENYCENWAAIDGFGGGLGLDGGMAEYMLVPSVRLLVPLGDLSPAKAAMAFSHQVLGSSTLGTATISSPGLGS